jgi:hypothetical protein
VPAEQPKKEVKTGLSFSLVDALYEAVELYYPSIKFPSRSATFYYWILLLASTDRNKITRKGSLSAVNSFTDQEYSDLLDCLCSIGSNNFDCVPTATIADLVDFRKTLSIQLLTKRAELERGAVVYGLEYLAALKPILATKSEAVQKTAIFNDIADIIRNNKETWLPKSTTLARFFSIINSGGHPASEVYPELSKKESVSKKEQNFIDAMKNLEKAIDEISITENIALELRETAATQEIDKIYKKQKSKTFIDKAINSLIGRAKIDRSSLLTSRDKDLMALAESPDYFTNIYISYKGGNRIRTIDSKAVLEEHLKTMSQDDINSYILEALKDGVDKLVLPDRSSSGKESFPSLRPSSNGIKSDNLSLRLDDVFSGVFLYPALDALAEGKKVEQLLQLTHLVLAQGTKRPEAKLAFNHLVTKTISVLPNQEAIRRYLVVLTLIDTFEDIRSVVDLDYIHNTNFFDFVMHGSFRKIKIKFPAMDGNKEKALYKTIVDIQEKMAERLLKLNVATSEYLDPYSTVHIDHPRYLVDVLTAFQYLIQGKSGAKQILSTRTQRDFFERQFSVVSKITSIFQGGIYSEHQIGSTGGLRAKVYELSEGIMAKVKEKNPDFYDKTLKLGKYAQFNEDHWKVLPPPTDDDFDIDF